jgi:hypothetical protein
VAEEEAVEVEAVVEVEVGVGVGGEVWEAAWEVVAAVAVVRAKP